MFGLFPISADAISGEGTATHELGVAAGGLAGTVTPDVSVAITGADATSSVGSVAGQSATVPLIGIAATASRGTLIPGITKGVTSEAGTIANPAYALTWTLGTASNSGATSYYGFRFQPNQTDLPSISHLGRFKIAGNTQVHTLYLYKYGGETNELLGSTSVDLAGKPDGQFVYGRLSTPIKLQINNSYYIYCQEFNGGDSWYDDATTTQDSYTAGIGQNDSDGGQLGSGFGSTPDVYNLRYPTGHTYGPLNFKTRTGRDSALTEVGDLEAGNWELAGLSATGSVGSLTVGSGSATAALTGVSATASPGTLTGVVGDNSVAITGIAATGSVGNILAPDTAELTGIGATSAVGSAGGAIQLGLTGISVHGTADLIGTSSPGVLTGIAATASVGTLGTQVSRPMHSFSATTHLGPLMLPMIPAPSSDAGTSRVRWVGRRVLVDGTDMVFGLSGPTSVEYGLEIGRNTAAFHVSDTAWPAAGNLWGNKPVEAYVSLGDSPRTMDESRVFTGYTLQKQDRCSIPTETGIVCTDGAIAYTGIPVCYSLGAYSGKTRGEIITEVAATVGVTLTDVPAGGIVNRPVTLNNANLLQFITEFGLVENWYPHIDRDGNLSVRVLGEPTTGWAVSAESGDFDLESLQETYPTRAPCRWYLTGTQVVLLTTEDGDPNLVTTVQVDEEEDLYNPKCRLSYDSSGHSLPSAQLMVVSRVTTEITTLAGQEIKKVTTTESFYNPESYDFNYNTFPTATFYNDAYLDNTFHRDAVESLMETSKVTVETTRDGSGTVTSQKVTTLGWHSPQSELNYHYQDDGESDPSWVKNGISISFIYGSDGKGHLYEQEKYEVVAETVTDYTYDDDSGVLKEQVATTTSWTAAKSACDILAIYNYKTGSGETFTSAQIANLPVPDTDWLAEGPRYYFVRRNFKYGDQDWRNQAWETFQTSKIVRTKFLVIDGQIQSTTERTDEFTNFETGPKQEWARFFQYPPFLFGDGKWYEQAVDFLGTTKIKYTRYEKFGSTGTATTRDEVDLRTGEVKLGSPTYAEGTGLDAPGPLAPTQGSSLRWARTPISSEIEVAGCAFVDNKANMDLQWAESVDDLNRAGIRAAQRAMAVVREFDCAWNPDVEVGDGLMLTSSQHGVSGWHVITEIKATVEIGADMHVTAEQWPEIG